MRSISPERWQRIEPLLERALELEEAARRDYLQEACGDDAELRTDVEALLAADAEAGSFLSRALGSEARSLLAAARAEGERRGRSDATGSTAGADREPIYQPGSLLSGRFQILGWLGRGGMGEVYRARDLKLDQEVALKLLPGSVERLGGLKRFLAEVRLARQITHPNVCRVYDVGEADGRHFLTMEFVAGEDLSELLARGEILDPDRARRIGAQICRGLAAAHREGILHRDLKPGNVRVGEDGRVRLMDFGLAAVASEVESEEMRLGTPAYMSPEQRASGEVTESSDIYALGLILFELFASRPPPDATAAGRTPPVSVAEGLDPALEGAILSCLEPDPAARPDSAAALLDVIVEQRRSPRRWRGVALAAAGLLVGAIAVVLIGSREDGPGSPPDPDPAVADARVPTRNRQAYELYLRGHDANASMQTEDLVRASELFERALALDPEFGLAYAGLANSIAQLARLRDSSAELERAAALAQRAIDLAPGQSEGYMALGLTRILKGEIDAAIEANLAAVRLDPAGDVALVNLAILLHEKGRYAESLSWALRSVKSNRGDAVAKAVVGFAYSPLRDFDASESWLAGLEPLMIVTIVRLADLVAQERFEEAIQLGRTAHERQANVVSALYLAGVLFLAGRLEEAEALYSSHLDVDLPTAEFLLVQPRTAVGYTALKRGERERAEALLTAGREHNLAAIAAGRENWQYPYDLALIHALRGEASEAVRWLERAERLGWRAWPIREQHPILAPLRDLPGYRELLTRIDRAVEEMRTEVGISPSGAATPR